MASIAIAQVDFPFESPVNPTATLDVNTKVRSPVNPMNLSLNYGSRAYSGFDSAGDKEQVRRFDPPSTRWPIGVWANWYNWKTDTWITDDSYDGDFDHIITGNPDKRYGFSGLQELHDELNFDILWSWNVGYDSPEYGVERLNDRFGKGFDFEWIELGNEIFWKGQRSHATSTVEKYMDVARAHAAALKAEDANIQLAVPTSWRNADGAGWNGGVMVDQSFYDAITVHKYIRYTEPTRADVVEVMNAGSLMIETARDMRALFPGKPMWFSEWGVTCGDNALSVLSMSDVFLTFFQNEDLFEMNQYHQVNGMDEFLTEENKKTSFGAGYDILRSVFLGSELYEGEETGSALSQGLPAVKSAAVNREGNMLVYAINRSPVAVPFELKIGGLAYAGTADHRALTFVDQNDFKIFEIEDDPLSIIEMDTNSILLPPFSISVIDGLEVQGDLGESILIEAEKASGQVGFAPMSVRAKVGGPTYLEMPLVDTNADEVLEAGVARYDFELNLSGTVMVEALCLLESGERDSFWYRIDGDEWEKQEGSAGGSWKWVTLGERAVLEAGAHSFEIAHREGGVLIDRFRLSSLDGRFSDSRVTLVGRDGITWIEAEGYDAGGEGYAYHERSLGNSGGAYRDEDVDIAADTQSSGGFMVTSVESGEWLSYPVEVEQAGAYDLRLRVSRTAEGDSSMRILLDDETVGGKLDVPVSSGLDTWISVEHQIRLSEGKHVLQLKFLGGAVNFDSFELEPVLINAGVDRTVFDLDLDGFEAVQLSGESNISGPGVTYAWAEDGVAFGSGKSVSVELEFGVHLISFLVTDGGTRYEDDLLITVEPDRSNGGAGLVVGWEKWNGADASINNGATGVFVSSSTWGTTATGSSTDGSIGSLSNPVASMTAIAADGDGFSSNTADDSLQFIVRGALPFDVSVFHFDAARRGGDVSSYELEVLSGSAITPGIVAGGDLLTTWGGDFQDIDIDLSGLEDRRIEAGEEAVFELRFSGGSSRLDFDNVGLSASVSQLAWGYPDSDGDSMPDYWEARYLGDLTGSAGDDFDKDLWSNFSEFASGTKPNDHLSRFAVRIERAGDGTMELVWPIVRGRRYKVFSMTDLKDGVWNLLADNLAGEGNMLSFGIPATAAFYRIEVIYP